MRCVTLLLAISLTVCAAIPMALIAIAVGLSDGRPVFFRQTRVGRGLQPFILLKFRTMRPDSSCDRTITVGEDARITRLGAWLRKYRLDELPQLFNIIRAT